MWLWFGTVSAGAGTVIEAHLDRKVGPVATLLVQAGTLKVGDIVCSGASYGKVCCPLILFSHMRCAWYA